MARPNKQTVDYFPHQCKHGKTMTILEKRYGNDGYAFWFKLLEKLGESEGHYLDLSKEEELIYVACETNLSEEKCKEMLDLLARLEAIDPELWKNENVVWSDNFVQNIEKVYNKRNCSRPEKPSFRDENPVSDSSTDESRVDSTKTQQSKVKKSKGKESKQKNSVSGSEEPVDDDPDPVEDFGEKAEKATQYLADRIEEFNPKTPIPEPDSQQWYRWVQAMDRLNRLGPKGGDDGYSWERIKSIIDWTFQDDFWAGQIQSATGLRDKVLKIENQMPDKTPANDRGDPDEGWEYTNDDDLAQAMNSSGGEKIA